MVRLEWVEDVIFRVRCAENDGGCVLDMKDMCPIETIVNRKGVEMRRNVNFRAQRHSDRITVVFSKAFKITWAEDVVPVAETTGIWPDMPDMPAVITPAVIVVVPSRMTVLTNGWSLFNPRVSDLSAPTGGTSAIPQSVCISTSLVLSFNNPVAFILPVFVMPPETVGRFWSVPGFNAL